MFEFVHASFLRRRIQGQRQEKVRKQCNEVCSVALRLRERGSGDRSHRISPVRWACSEGNWEV